MGPFTNVRFWMCFFALGAVLFYIPAGFTQGLSSRSDQGRSFWQFELDKETHRWFYTKRIPDFGDISLDFSMSYTIKNLPTVVQKLISTPWYKVIEPQRDPFGDNLEAPFDKIPIMRLYVADIDSMPAYHETSFAAFDSLVAGNEGSAFVDGLLRSAELKMTNSVTEPAFYTHIHPNNGVMLGRKSELLLKVETSYKRKVFVLELNEPASEAEKASFFQILTGDAEYWENLKRASSRGDVYDFDIFHNAVRRALRERHQLPVDMMIYTKDFTPVMMGRPSRMIYNWLIFYERTLLDGARISMGFFHPFSRQLTKKNIDAELAPLSREALRAFIQHPELPVALVELFQNTSFFAEEIKQFAAEKGISESDISGVFWQKIYPMLQRRSISSSFAAIWGDMGEKYTMESLRAAIRTQLRSSLKNHYSRMLKAKSHKLPEVWLLDVSDGISDELLEKHGVNEIAEELVKRLRQSPRKHRPQEEMVPEILSNSDLQIWFEEKDVASVVRTQKILNVYQSKTIRSEAYLKKRFARENMMLGIMLYTGSGRPSGGSKIAALFPKYAILDVHTDVDIGKQNIGGTNYGEFAFVLKDAVKRRATWADDDSYDGFVRVKPFEDTFLRRKGSRPYLEAQVWGDVGLGDVDYILVPENIKPAIFGYLKTLNIPVWSWKETNVKGRIRNSKNHLLFSPSSACSKLFSAGS